MGMLATWKQKKLDKILNELRENIASPNDLLANEKPSFIFYLLANKLGYLLDNNPEKTLSNEGIRNRRKINIIIRKIGPLFLSNPQQIENRNKLIDSKSNQKDEGILLPNKPVIWCANHVFKDDTLASILAIKRNAYIVFGSVPQFYNTFDGVTAWLNGVVMTNRKMRLSKRASMQKAKKVIEMGTDVFMFPEGVWNKSPNALLLDFWPGVYKLAVENGAEVVPIVHYIREPSKKNKENLIHTVVDDPINIGDMSQEDALECLREKMSTWLYLMMEKYGQSTRAEVLGNCKTSKEMWEEHLIERTKTAARYDLEIELCADYRRKDIIRSEDVFENIANIEKVSGSNIQHFVEAFRVVREEKDNDFQRRF